MNASFTHLHTHSYFSLLDGAASPKQLCRHAAELGMEAIALTDHNTLAGAVRFFQAAQETGIKPIIGAEFTVELAGETNLGEFDHPGFTSAQSRSYRTDTTTDYTRHAHIVLLAVDNEGYRNLCRLVTSARLGQAQYSGPFSEEFEQVDRKKPVLFQQHLRRHASNLVCLSGCAKGEIPRLINAGKWRAAKAVAEYYSQLFGDGNFYIELHNHLLPLPAAHLRYKLQKLAKQMALPTVATNNVHYTDRDMAKAQDVLVCIRALQTVEEYHPDRKANAEYGLKAPDRMAQLFGDQPQAIENTQKIADRCNWQLDLDTFHLPKFDLQSVGEMDWDHRFDEADADSKGSTEEGNGENWPAPEADETTCEYLRRLCYYRAERLYPQIDDTVRQRIDHELQIIHQLGFCDYFLIVWDICCFARSRRIMTSGRGSAGDSIVTYLLNITSVDPLEHELLFERFLNPKRGQMPDIDVDFDSRRRDEVVEYIYNRYGNDRVAAVCTVNRFRAKSAIRAIGGALDMDEGRIGKIAKSMPHINASEIEQAAENFPELRDSNIDLSDSKLLLDLCEKISNFPRHLSVHVGGLLIGAEPLTNLVPLALANKGIVICEFDKDDVEALGLVKMDILGLRIHTAISDCLKLIEGGTGRRIDLESIPLDDGVTYKLLRSTYTAGLFQLESPGQRNLLGRAQPAEFEEVIANISLFRPGPVQSDMITPYLRRKHGQQPVTYPHPDLEPIMHRTFGVLIYQEQVLEIASAIAGFSLGQADQLRRMMTSDKSPEEIQQIGESFIQRAIQRGVERSTAEEIFDMVSGFAAYGFCKAHAACFGKIAYQTAWLKAHYPAEFLAGILSAQPMGFYPPRTIGEEARRFGCDILPPSVNKSEDIYTVENGDIRIGLRLLKGMSESGLHSILDARAANGPFKSLRDFCERTGVCRPMIEKLILVRAFQFTDRTEQQLLWLLASLPQSVVSGDGADSRSKDTGGSQTIAAKRTNDKNTDAFPPQFTFHTPDGVLQKLPASESITPVQRVALDLNIAGVSTTVNPLYFWRERFRQLDVIPSRELYYYPDGDTVRVAGIVIARARPPTRSGKTAIFIYLEDEFGLVDVAVFEDCYERCGRAIYNSPLLYVEGELTRQGKLDLSVTAKNVVALGDWQDIGDDDDDIENATGEPSPTDSRSPQDETSRRWKAEPNARVGERRH